MAASRTAAATIPEELKRQSDRINEQLSQLNRILDIIISRLNDMSTMMNNYSPALVKQFTNLKTYLEAYKGKASNIYSDMSLSLSVYAYNLLQNLDNLTNSVDSIGHIVEDL